MSANSNLPNTIGVIGLGAMGLPMAQRFVSAGFKINGFDLNQDRLELAKSAGVGIENGVDEVCAGSEIIIICLPNPAASGEVIQGIIAQKGQTKLVIETSTLLPADVINFTQQLSAVDIDFLSAPMFGGQSSAETGQIWFVVEGEKAVFEKYQNLFTPIGRKVSYVGKPPQATIAKLARNLCRFANVANAIEVINFVRNYTDDIKPIYDLLAEDSLTNFDHVWDKTLKGYALNDEEYYTSHISVKDLKLALGMAEAAGIDLPIARVAKKLHEEMQKPDAE